MTNKLILLALAAVITLAANAYDFIENDIAYNINSDGLTVEVTSGDSGYTGAITIPESVTHSSQTYQVTAIGSSAFYGCTGLTSMTIPNSVITIGNYAFQNCSGLTSLTIPNSVTSIGSSAFLGCSGLTSIIVDVGNTVYDSRGNCNAIITTSSNTLILGCQNTVIPNSVTSIGNYAFAQCDGLTSVIIPNSVTSIGTSAFYYCTGLTNVTIGNSVTTINGYAFQGCSSLTSISIPNSVTTIRNFAFAACNNLTNVTLTGFGEWTLTKNMPFGNMTTLNIGSGIISLGALQVAPAIVNCYAETPPTCMSNTFSSYDGALHVPSSATTAYSNADYWKNFTNISFDANDKVTFGQSEVEMSVQDELALTVTVNPVGSTLNWSTSNSQVATVNDSGVVTAVSEGSCYIYCKMADNDAVYARCSVTVTTTLVTDITISQSTADMLIGNTLQLTATVSPDNATNPSVAWSSSNPVIATVNDTGLVTAKNAGTAIITASTLDGTDLNATCQLTVYSKPVMGDCAVSLVSTIEQWNQYNNVKLNISGTYATSTANKGVVLYSVDGGTWVEFTTQLNGGQSFSETVQVSFNPSVAQHTLRVKAKDAMGEYSNEVTVLQAIDASTLIFDDPEVEYTGQPITFQPSIYDMVNNQLLTENTHFTSSFSNNIVVGNATLLINGVFPNYIGQNTYEFYINPHTIAGQVYLVDGTQYYHTGSPITPSVAVIDDVFGSLTLGLDYELDYFNNVEIGMATAVVEGIGNFDGTINLPFEILDPPMNEADYVVLKSFYNQYQNDQFTWNLSDAVSAKYCDGLTVENERVVAIDLSNKGLQGGFPVMLLSLDQLLTLDLSHNQLNGDAAAVINEYVTANSIAGTPLQSLYINNNEFNGNVGIIAAMFTNLTALNVAENHFDNVYPMVDPAVTLNLNNQSLQMDADITAGMQTLASSIPAICLYNHVDQIFTTNINAQLTNPEQSPQWTMDLSFVDGELNMYTNQDYHGTNGQVLGAVTNLTGSWHNEQRLQVALTFAPGDANFNGPVDITDLQAMVNHIFGEYAKPFNFTAANLNGDNTVNVQDIVGEANLLLSMDLEPTSNATQRMATKGSNYEASLYWQNGVLYLSTPVPIAAIDIINKVRGEIQWDVARFGMVVKTTITSQGEHAVLYSLTDAVIPTGETAIAFATVGSPKVIAARLSDSEAEMVSVYLNDVVTSISDLYGTGYGNIHCVINGTNLLISSSSALKDINVDIYTIDGRMLFSKQLTELSSGTTSVDVNDLTGNFFIVVVRHGNQVIATQKIAQTK